jgi:hypothetical protein
VTTSIFATCFHTRDPAVSACILGSARWCGRRN